MTVISYRLLDGDTAEDLGPATDEPIRASAQDAITGLFLVDPAGNPIPLDLADSDCRKVYVVAYDDKFVQFGGNAPEAFIPTGRPIHTPDAWAKVQTAPTGTELEEALERILSQYSIPLYLVIDDASGPALADRGDLASDLANAARAVLATQRSTKP